MKMSRINDEETLDTAIATLAPTKTLGSLQLRDKTTQKILLIPTPSGDPNDPLNWYTLMDLIVRVS